MKTLVFDRSSRMEGGRRVRDARFADRSSLPVSAACLVGNALRETLAALLACEVEVRVFAPVLPAAAAWHAIANDAFVYRLRGTCGDAALVLRACDALALAAAAFGEPSDAARPLSPIERIVLDRAVAAIAGAAAPVCGPLIGAPDAVAPESLAGFATYFEVQIERPIRARIGVALARDPDPPVGAALPAEALLDLELELRVALAGAPITAGALAGLELGAIVPMTETTTPAGRLILAGRVIARGECGVIGSRFAFAIGPSPEGSPGTPA
ncbi:MAG: FliM/FliN family flagellar motor switch protein [bacterium]|nr:FliM/FliN family flagellar motor switch protein [bacterium]